MAMQEISTMIRHCLNIVIPVLENDGNMIERVIHGLKERYNYVTCWRYPDAPSLFGTAEDAITASAGTLGGGSLNLSWRIRD
jgi:pyruvate decarboxylase